MSIMKCVILALLAGVAALNLKYAPVTFQSKGGLCGEVQCPAMDCKAPFEFSNAEANGTCCPLCVSKIAVPEDRSWVENLAESAGLAPSADPAKCHKTWCPSLLCANEDQVETPGRCCRHCKGQF